MKTIKCVALSVALSVSIAFGGGLKDSQLEAPFNNVIVHPYDQLTVYKPVGKYNGATLVCLIRNVESIHPEIAVQLLSANLMPNNNDSGDGLYRLAGDQTIYIYKYSIQPMDSQYPTYFRFIDYGRIESQRFSLSCKYA